MKVNECCNDTPARKTDSAVLGDLVREDNIIYKFAIKGCAIKSKYCIVLSY